MYYQWYHILLLSIPENEVDGSGIWLGILDYNAHLKSFFNKWEHSRASLTFTKWEITQPYINSHSDKKCSLMKTANKKLEVAKCDDMYPFICEFNGKSFRNMQF